jgi:hypothetical protein
MPLRPISGISRPSILRPPAQERKYPLSTMAVGEMLFVTDASREAITSYISHRGKTLGRKFRSQVVHMRKTRDGWEACDAAHPKATTGVGIWRVL